MDFKFLTAIFFSMKKYISGISTFMEKRDVCLIPCLRFHYSYRFTFEMILDSIRILQPLFSQNYADVDVIYDDKLYELKKEKF